jgi:serine/threonine-protein kinase
VTEQTVKLESLAPGDVIRGEYRIEELLGQGGMAYVYRVRHVTLNFAAALKTPKAGLEQALVDRFLLEAQAHFQLSSEPHVVNPKAFGQLPDGRPYLVMDLVDGVTLDVWLHQHPDDAKDLPLMLRFGIQIAQGLTALHSLTPPIIHRDLKPANIFVESRRTVAIAGVHVPLLRLNDFGLAWFQGQELLHSGTPEYVSPEQSLGLEPTTASDLYTLGVILYELIEQKVPFQDADTVALLRKHQEQPAPKLGRGCPPELIDLVSSLLDKDPTKRPSSSRTVEVQLEGIIRRFEGNDQRTVRASLSSITGTAPTQKLPPPEQRATNMVGEAPLETGKRDTQSAPELRRPPSRVGLAVAAVLLLLGGVFGVRALTAEAPKPPPEANTVAEPVKPVKPVEPVVKVPDPVPVALAPIDAGPSLVEDDPLAPISAKVPKAPVKPKVLCEPDARWKKTSMLNLAELEGRANTMAPVEIERAVGKLGAEVQAAATPEDCGRVTEKIEALVKRAIKN